MARMLSQVATKIRGSVGGLTYSANQYYQIIMKARTSPVQPNTTLQQQARAAIVSAASAWTQMTDAQREQWKIYALNLRWPDPLGTHKCPGRQAFMAGRSIQQYVLATGLAIPNYVVDGPGFFDGFLLPQSVTVGNPVGPGTGIGVSVSADFTDDTLALIEISPAMGPTRLRYKGPWDTHSSQAAIIPANTTVNVDFLGYNVGDILFARVKCVGDDAPPRVSIQYILRGTAVTVP